MKKISLLLAAVMLLTLMLSACGQKAASAETTTAAAAETTTAASAETTTAAAAETTTAAAPAAVKKIDFYGKIVEYPAGPSACDKMQELLKDKYEINALQVDWGNLDTVIRTGISGGTPCDVYEYWPQNMKALVSSGMATDLTPYIEKDPDLKQLIPEAALNAGKYDGKYYSIPWASNFSLIVANKDLLDAKGITIPDNWNWQQFTDVCKQLKAAGVFPMGQNTDNQQGHWFFRNGLLSMAASSDKLEDMAAGKIPCTDDIFKTVFTNVKELYDNKYMYPGDGAVTVTRDEVKAGFMQGKVAFIGDIAAGVTGTIKDAKDAGINTVVLPWPSMGSTNAVLGGYDGLFIPSNAKDPDASFEVIKTYLSADVQKLYADSGMAIVNTSVQITDPTVQNVVSLSKSVYPFEFMTIDAKINDYMTNQALAEVVLGGGVESAQKALESLRAAVVK
jgi:ABC-type glycerol-3-phosphate transport system substrate-binding protein